MCEIVNRLALNDKVDLCQQLHLCVPGVYPLIFNFRVLPQKKKEIGVENPYSILLQYLEVRPQIILPKNILVHDTRSDRDIFFGIDDLQPSKRELDLYKLLCIERPSVYIIMRKDPRNKHYTEISNLEQTCWYEAPSNGRLSKNDQRDEGESYDQTCQALADSLLQGELSGHLVGETLSGSQTQRHARDDRESYCQQIIQPEEPPFEASDSTEAHREQHPEDLASGTLEKEKADHEIQPKDYTGDAVERIQAQHHKHTENESEDLRDEQQPSNGNIAAPPQTQSNDIYDPEVGWNLKKKYYMHHRQ